MGLGQTTFQSNIDVVLVPVVVRDSQGKPIGDLTKNDFLLFDKGKLQSVASFEAIRRGRSGSPAPARVDLPSANVEKSANETDSGRYLIYLFDDLNIRFADMCGCRSIFSKRFGRRRSSGDLYFLRPAGVGVHARAAEA
jgi:VWFA-related protein